MRKGALILITTSYPLSGDGSEAAGGFVAELAALLAERIPVRVVAPGQGPDRERISRNLEIFRYSAPARPLSTLNPWHPLDAWRILRVLNEGRRATAAALAAGPSAHLLALWSLPCGAWARTQARWNRLPYSVWALGSDIWSLSRLPLIRRYLIRVLREARHRFADGLALAAEVEALSGLPAVFLPSARSPRRDTPAPPRREPPYRLLFLGRWHPNKGTDLLLEALEGLSEDDWRKIAAVEIAGDGPLRAALQPRIEALRAAGRPIECPGFLNRERALAALAQADLVLIPSRIESIPLVLSDALAARRPVVATPVGDLPHLAAQYGIGFLARSPTAADWREALRDALSAGPAWAASSLQGATELFSLPAIAQRLLATLFSE